MGAEEASVLTDTKALYNTTVAPERYVADNSAHYGENIDSLIEQARNDMERAAKSLDFMAAARYRDRMYELQQIKEEQLQYRR